MRAKGVWMQGYEGDPRGECGNYTLVRNGTSYESATPAAAPAAVAEAKEPTKKGAPGEVIPAPFIPLPVRCGDQNSTRSAFQGKDFARPSGEATSSPSPR